MELLASSNTRPRALTEWNMHSNCVQCNHVLKRTTNTKGKCDCMMSHVILLCMAAFTLIVFH